jgi:hypothetical protein
MDDLVQIDRKQSVISIRFLRYFLIEQDYCNPRNALFSNAYLTSNAVLFKLSL